MKRFFQITLLSLLAAFILIQFVPYGRNHTNPPSRVEPKWDKPETRALAVRACFDCHSNETVWPWYSHVAPASWLVQKDVDHGRHELNFSQWDRPQDEADEAAEQVRKGKMPLEIYVVLHPSAKLSPAERDALTSGLTLTISADGGGKAKRSVYDGFDE